MSTKQNDTFLEYMEQKIWEAGDYEEEQKLLGFLIELGFENEADRIKEEMKESDELAKEDYQNKQNIIYK